MYLEVQEMCVVVWYKIVNELLQKYLQAHLVKYFWEVVGENVPVSPGEESGFDFGFVRIFEGSKKL